MSAYYFKKGKSSIKKYKKPAGIIFIILGFLVFLYFLFPLFAYQFFLARAFSDANIEVPIPKYLVVNDTDLGSLISQGISSLTRDYTDARNWYPDLSNSKSLSATKEDKKVDSYLLSIPKIEIENVDVSTKDYELDKHLIQYLGTSLPGEDGTAVIFGHSTLPQLFDPKNYKTILANAHKLVIGDEILATVGKVTYKYKIFAIVITKPEDTNILSQSYDHSYITLVTCTPPGTIWKRLVIRAALIDSEDSSI